MEITIQWFFIIKLIVTGMFFYSVYKTYKSNFKNKLWLVASLVMLIMLIISPVKMDVNVAKQNNRINADIANSKTIPPMIEDNSFRNRVNDLRGITGEDLK